RRLHRSRGRAGHSAGRGHRSEPAPRPYVDVERGPLSRGRVVRADPRRWRPDLPAVPAGWRLTYDTDERARMTSNLNPPSLTITAVSPPAEEGSLVRVRQLRTLHAPKAGRWPVAM